VVIARCTTRKLGEQVSRLRERGNRRGARRSVGLVIAGAVLLAGGAGCAGPPSRVPVPTFPAASATPTIVAAAGPALVGHLPADCEQMVGRDELPMLFGLPVDSVAVQTVQGVPAPSVGRLERLDCTYTVADPGTPQQGVVLQMTVGLFADAAAARDQHGRNVADEGVGGSTSDQSGLGAAVASAVQRGSETVLLTCYDAVTVDLHLPGRPAPLPPRDLLTDLARRVLARVAPQPPAAAPIGP
jgi:hypothetical protein